MPSWRIIATVSPAATTVTIICTNSIRIVSPIPRRIEVMAMNWNSTGMVRNAARA